MSTTRISGILFWTWEREFSLRCKVQFGTIKFQQEFFFTKMMLLLFEYVQKRSALRAPEIMSLLLQIKSKIKNYNYTINSALKICQKMNKRMV